MLVSAVALVLLQLVISVRTELVAVPVTVTDTQGRRVAGLDQENFHVFEDGRPRPITVFHRGDVAVTLGLIVDRSQSMRPKDAALVAAVSALLRSTRPDDELFGVTFNDRAALVGGGAGRFTNDPRALGDSLVAVRAEGQTSLNDAVAVGLEQLAAGHTDLRALVVVSDGGDNVSRRTYQEILSLAQRSNAVIYTIGLVGTPPAVEEEDAGLLIRLCRDTGGAAFFPRTLEEVDAMATRVAGDLRQQYTLGFVPSDPGDRDAFRKIDVRVTAPGRSRLKVRTRSGYLAAGGQAGRHDQDTP
jgi:Ca-activated chloride channel homolog